MRHPVLMIVQTSAHAKHVQKFFTPAEVVAVPMMRAPLPGFQFRAVIVDTPDQPPEGFAAWLDTHIRPRLAPDCQGRITYLGPRP